MKKTLLTLVTIVLLTASSYAQVAINESGAQPDASAILDISSNNKGLLIPRVTTTLRNEISTTQSGLLVYDTTTESFWYYDNTQTSWIEIVVDGVMGIDGLSDGKADASSVFLGNSSGTNDDGDNNNSALGFKSLFSSTSGAHNTSLGSYNMFYNTSGSRNVSIGRKSNYYNQEGNNNTIVGYWAGTGTSNHNKSGNIFLGYMAGYSETGDNKLYIENSSSSTPLIGGDFSTREIYLNGTIKITDGSQGSGKILTSGVDGTATWEQNSAAFDIDGLSDAKADASNLFLGNYSGVNDDGDNKTTGVGINSLYWNSSGTRNTALGYKSAYRNTTGISNVAIGGEALYFNTTKNNLVAIGDSALYYNGNNSPTSIQATLNTAIGSKAMLNNSTGYNNSSLGSKSLYSNTTGFNNVGLGYSSLGENTDGSYNLAAGTYSSGVNGSGNNNVSLGYGADYYNNGGSNNVVIGTHAGRGSSGNNKSGNIFIGYKSGYSETGNNKLYIQNSESTSPLIYGDFSASKLGFNGDVGIGTTNPLKNLHILGSSTLSSLLIAPDVSGNGGDSEILLSEDDDFTYGMSIKYDGGDDRMYFYAKVESDYSTPYLTIKRNGSVGIGTYNPSELFEVVSTGDNKAASFTGEGEGTPDATISSINTGTAGIAGFFQSYGTDATIIFRQNGTGVISKAIGPSGGDVWDLNGDGSMEFYNSPGNRTISIDPSESGSTDAGQITLYSADGATATIEIDGAYGGNGRITTNELQITGGSDLSEFFDLSDYDNVEKGMVVSIDENIPGHLTISQTAYDKKVAGIVSGANSIKPGLIMSQKGTIADGEHLVALSGRVYCMVDATRNPVNIGDMLTTSNVAGHAMKVDNFQKARGAIIGKAMTSLTSGKGLVLVLVTLQ